MYQSKLRQEIDQRFNGEELRLICAELGLNYDDDLIGRTKDARILSLVQYIISRNRLDQLVSVLEQHRPDVDWPATLSQDEDQNQIITNLDGLKILLTQNRAVQAGLGVLTLAGFIGCIALIGLVVFLNQDNRAENPTTPATQVAINETPPASSRTPTIQETAETITPSPTPEPIPDVVIIEFEGAMERDILLARRIEDNLRQTLDEYSLEDINIRLQTEPINSIADAQALATQYGSKVVVWGYLDAVGVNVRIFLNDEKQSRRLAGTNELPLSDFEDTQSELAFLATETIPENVSFISLFVVGQLYYQNNRYQEGFNAFNAATNNLPEDVIFTNEALLYFFEARQLDYGGSDELEQIACGYARAIDTDLDFVPAYLNLAIFLFQNPEIESAECLNNTNYSLLMSQALALQPESALLQYNDLALRGGIGLFAEDEDVAAVQEIIAADPSISGAYLLLARLHLLRGEWDEAKSSLETAVTLLPDLVEPHFNLGQLYIITSELDKAEEQLTLTLEMIPGDEETLLALANLAYQQGDSDQAAGLLAQLTPFDGSYIKTTTAYTANLFQSRLAYDSGDITQAIAIIEQPAGPDNPYYIYDYFTSYLLGNLYQQLGDEATANAVFQTGVDSGVQYKPIIVLRSENTTPGLIWFALDLRCDLFEQTDIGRRDLRDLSNCGPGTLVSGRTMTTAEHLDYIYDTLQNFLAQRFKNIPDVFLGQG